MSYITKGTVAIVSGRVLMGSYFNDQEKKVYTTDFVVDEVEPYFAPKTEKPESHITSYQNNNEEENGITPYSYDENMIANVTDEDLPF